ncbi:MAG TPA: nucleotide exchange factor GrpE [Longimicrobiales bacterium]|nr:nucleotide exchange factor GrpE [Longimicrobiales bacterium]
MTDPVANTEEQEPTEEPTEEAMEGRADPELDTDEDLAAAEATLRELDELALEVEGSMDAELVALREEFEGLNDRHLRLAAEFNNYRRRVEAERTELWSRAQADLVAKFLDVLDDLQRVAGLDLGNATVEAIMEGIDLVDRKFMRVLADAGVEVLDPVGEPFSPETMEAMMRVPTESEEDDETVDQVFQKGYTLKGQLVRPARVSVRQRG